MICPKCGSTVPDILAKCADCKIVTNQLDHGRGKPVYCASCGGKRKAKQRKAAQRKADKAIQPKEDKGA